MWILAAAIASDRHDTTDTPMADHGPPPDTFGPISEARHVPGHDAAQTAKIY